MFLFIVGTKRRSYKVANDVKESLRRRSSLYLVLEAVFQEGLDLLRSKVRSLGDPALAQLKCVLIFTPVEKVKVQGIAGL